MSMTFSRNSAGVNRLKDLWNKPLMPYECHVPALRGYGKRKLTLVELLFQLQERDQSDSSDDKYF